MNYTNIKCNYRSSTLRRRDSVRVLCIIPPQVISYFNAGHHLVVYQVAEYISRLVGKENVMAVDSSVYGHTWRDCCRILGNQFDIVVLVNDIDGVDTFERFVSYAKRISPLAKIITVGRLSAMNPDAFKDARIDAIGYQGDYELMAESYCRYLISGTDPDGLIVNQSGNWIYFPCRSRLAPEEWGSPDYSEIPILRHLDLYKEEKNKFCGISGMRELVVQVSRGCPMGCSFCEVGALQGTHERRLSVPALMDYLIKQESKVEFDYVSFYSPIFTLDKDWVIEYCQQNMSLANPRKWKCVTTFNMLENGLIEEMGKAGCFRIGIGVESIIACENYKMTKNNGLSIESLRELNEKCKSMKIELNCFMMLGLREETDSPLETFTCLSNIDGLKVRPTVYSDYAEMVKETSLDGQWKYSRQLVDEKISQENNSSGEYCSKIYQAIYGNSEDAHCERKESEQNG